MDFRFSRRKQGIEPLCRPHRDAIRIRLCNVGSDDGQQGTFAGIIRTTPVGPKAGHVHAAHVHNGGEPQHVGPGQPGQHKERTGYDCTIA